MQIRLATIDLKDFGRHAIEHVTVVSNQQQTTVVISQPFFKICNGIKVEMVGGFVQNERFPFANQQTGERNPLLLTARQLVGLTINQTAHA